MMDAEVFIRQGDKLREAGQFDEAIKACQEAISLEPENATARYKLGNILVDLGRLEDAVNTYNLSISIKPNSPEALINLGVALSKLGRHKEAEITYKKAIELEPHSPEALCNLGVSLNELGCLDEAVKVYRQAIELKPDLAMAYVNLGDALNSLGQFEEGMDVCHKALKLEPNMAEAYNNLGLIFFSLGRLEEALKAYKQAILLKPDFTHLHVTIGDTLIELSRYEEAVKSYEQAIELNSYGPNTYLNIGFALSKLNRFCEGLEPFDQAIKIKPDFIEAYLGRASCLSRLGRYQEALKDYHQAFKLSPNSARVWKNIGHFLLYLKSCNVQSEDLNLFAKDQFSHPLSCLTRAVYLDQSEKFNFKAEILEAFQSYHQHAPLLIHRIFQEAPILQSSFKFSNLLSITNRQCEVPLKLLQFLNSGRHTLLPNDVLKLSGLFYYYLGDFPKAHETFQALSILEDSDRELYGREDLAGKFYLVLAMAGYCEPHEEELRSALEHAGGWLEGRIQSKPDNFFPCEQWYYAAQIFLCENHVEEALTCLEKTKGFLPALYLKAWLFHQKGHQGLLEDTLNAILHQEESFFETGQQGFLQGILPQKIDLTVAGWDKPLRHYAYYSEISGEIQFVQDELEACGRQPKIPVKVGSLLDPWQAVENWILTQQSQAKLKELAKQDLAREKERWHGQLQKVAGLRPYLTMEGHEFLKALIDLVEQKVCCCSLEDFWLLVRWGCAEERLDYLEGALISFYAALKVQSGKRTSEVTMAIISAALGGVAGSALGHFLTSAFWGIGVGGVVPAILTALNEYSKARLLKNKKISELSYLQFKREFGEFVLKQDWGNRILDLTDTPIVQRT